MGTIIARKKGHGSVSLKENVCSLYSYKDLKIISYDDTSAPSFPVYSGVPGSHIGEVALLTALYFLPQPQF